MQKQFGIDKVVPVPLDLSKLSDVVKNDVVKKTVYDKLVAKVNRVDTSGFVLKFKNDADKSELGKKIPERGLVKKTDFSAKLNEIYNKIFSTSGLATNAAVMMLVEWLRKQAITQVELKRKMSIVIMTNILLLQSLISLQ